MRLDGPGEGDPGRRTQKGTPTKKGLTLRKGDESGTHAGFFVEKVRGHAHVK